MSQPVSQKELADAPLATLMDLRISGCACGRIHHVPTLEVALESGALKQLPEMAAKYVSGGPIVCVVDRNTWPIAGEKAVGLLETSGRSVIVHSLGRSLEPVHADQQGVEDLVDVIRDQKCSGVVAVGSGTINDICKSAATITQLPLVTVATAASMNGYTSAISALTVHGLKTTEACSPPTAIIADPEVLATAPNRMAAAGLGDLLSKNASTADWLMSHILLGEYYCNLPSVVVEKALQGCIDRVEAIGANQPGGLQVLIDALLRSGISMVLAGSSSPASGGEHLISHLWDMTAHWSGRTPALHGQQTGVTTLISLALYEKLLGLDADAIRRRPVIPLFEDLTRFENAMQTAFKDMADAVLPFARRKYLDKSMLEERRNLIVSRWDDIRRSVSAVVIPADRCRSYLKRAGAACQAADLQITPHELAFACRYARWIRDRYTVLDLAADIGMLDEWVDQIAL